MKLNAFLSNIIWILRDELINSPGKKMIKTGSWFVDGEIWVEFIKEHKSVHIHKKYGVRDYDFLIDENMIIKDLKENGVETQIVLGENSSKDEIDDISNIISTIWESMQKYNGYIFY